MNGEVRVRMKGKEGGEVEFILNNEGVLITFLDQDQGRVGVRIPPRVLLTADQILLVGTMLKQGKLS